MRAGMGQERKVAPSRFRQGLRGDAWPSPTDRCSKTLLRQPGQHPVTSCASAPCCDCASLANRMRVRLCSRSHSLIALRFSFIAAVSCCESVARLCTALHCTCTYAAAPSPTTTLNDCVCHRNVDAWTDGSRTLGACDLSSLLGTTSFAHDNGEFHFLAALNRVFAHCVRQSPSASALGAQLRLWSGDRPRTPRSPRTRTPRCCCR